MKKVVCINDKKLPEGAKVVEGKEYTVKDEYLNSLDQRVYIIDGIENEGTTKWGMRWIGYDSKRFAELDKTELQSEEFNYALN
tara:strand:+ start:102 stop:350 length:249 start_codon:yes stop_codon:yes gene_type:complete